MLVQQRNEERFVPLKSKSILKKAEDEAGQSAAEINKFYGEVAEFYSTCHAYLQKWMLPLNEFSIFNWMLLVSVPQWNLVEQTVEFLHAKGQSIDESLLFDQFSCLKACIEAVLVNEKDDWNKKSGQEKWAYFFNQCECVEQYSELLKLCEYIFSVPGHNTNVERVFSLMNMQWTEERSRLEVSTVEAIIKCVFN
ncbi:hypothetical protein C0J52_22736 [Blattella germanica]|nr:hypothetical protein C0J52_22736 [Blattella germanica]